MIRLALLLPLASAACATAPIGPAADRGGGLTYRRADLPGCAA